MSRVFRYSVCALLTALVLSASAGIAQQGAKGGEWRSYAGDSGSSRYAPYDQITRDNGKDKPNQPLQRHGGDAGPQPERSARRRGVGLSGNHMRG